MSARVEPAEAGSASERTQLEEWFRSEGLTPQAWSNGPADTYEWHRHDYHKVLVCVSGSIVFHTHEGDFELRPGDRLDVEPGTDHAATVGPHGVECIEAPRHAPPWDSTQP